MFEVLSENMSFGWVLENAGQLLTMLVQAEDFDATKLAESDCRGWSCSQRRGALADTRYACTSSVVCTVDRRIT